VPNGSTSIQTAGGVVGQFKYQPLLTPVGLQANTMYYLVSQEVSGGDRWYGVNGTVLTTLNAATVNSGVFMGNGYGWSLAGSPAHAYGPVDFKLDPAGAPNPAVTPAAFGADTAVVAPGEVTLQVWTYQAQVLVRVRGRAGQHWVLEASQDLVDWLPLAEHTLERDEVNIADVEPDRPPFRFYRPALRR